MTSIGLFFFIVLFVSCFIVSMNLTNLSFRSMKHNYVKNNLSAKLFCIPTFGKMKLEDFKNLIFVADYKMCTSKMEKNST